ncbi:MAG: DUF2520 domain-containing protein [Deltaproteobacteria bacterium]|nr:DUF2520 domain-containing protein [Deltaproteobacteria bacterium]
MTTNKDSIVIIGLGKVGTAIGFLLRNAGYLVLGIIDQSDSAAQKALDYTGGKICSISSLSGVNPDCIIITTVDDAIASVCETLCREGVIKPGVKVIHMSGAGGLDLLGCAKSKGAFVGSIHPVQSFSDIEGAIRNIPGSVFGVTVDDEIKNWSIDLVKELKGTPFFVSAEDKSLYHAAACIASNYLTALLYMVVEIYKHLGLKQDDAVKAFLPLVKGTLANIEHQGPVMALTGPIARGDIGTIKKHLDVFEKTLPDYRQIYAELGAITADVGLLKGSIDDRKADAIKKILKGG